MARYLARQCPKCGGDLWIVLPKRKLTIVLRAINGRCTICGYRLAWILVLSRTEQQPNHVARVPRL